MARRKSKGFNQDLSSFMCVILMVIGIMCIVLITNVVMIISNPENIRITSIIQSAGAWGEGETDLAGNQPFPFGNKDKEPIYVDVEKDHLVLYPEQDVVALRDLETPGNPFEKLLDYAQENKDEEYIVLLARPGTARLVHRIKKVIRARDIDLGFELYEADRPIEYERAAKASGRGKEEPQ